MFADVVEEAEEVLSNICCEADCLKNCVKRPGYNRCSGYESVTFP